MLFRSGLLWAQKYSAKYEYIYGGKKCHVGSADTSSFKKKVGTKVTIAVNEKTGEAFCVQETKDYYLFGGIMIILSFLIICMLVREFFIPV